MRRVAILALFFVAACDSQIDPEGASNSPFLKESDNERQLAGLVFSGTEVVERVPVRMDPSAIYLSDARLAATKDPAWSTFTAAGGVYRFYNAPLRYDLTITRGSEVITFRDLVYRYVEPSIGENPTLQTFRAKTRLLVQPPPKAGSVVTLFAGGTDVTGFRFDTARAEGEIDVRQYATTATVFAVEHDAVKGIGSATSWARVDVSVTANAVVEAALTLVPLIDKPTPIVINTKAPPGFVVDQVEVVVDFGVERSAAVVAKVPSGGSVTYTPIPFSRPLARARATRADGATSWSPAMFVDPKLGKMELELPGPPEDLEPPAGVGGTLFATGKGVHEHVLVPASGTGTSLRVVAIEGHATLPDVTRSGLPVPSGKYVWTVARWPDVSLPDFFSGREVRKVFSTARSAPREVVFP